MAIRIAITNFYRAYEQRSRWSRDGLVKPGELKAYLKKLEEEWEFHLSTMQPDFDLSSDDQCKRLGRGVYDKCQETSCPTASGRILTIPTSPGGVITRWLMS